VIQLDTSFLIRALVAGTPQDKLLRQWLTDGEALSMSAIAWTEFLCGPLQPNEAKLAEQLIDEVLPLVTEDAEVAALLFNSSGRRRGSLVDCLVAASAFRRDAPLATANASDFKRMEAYGLRVVI
jgi:predicted nucleic acid-binding protein